MHTIGLRFKYVRLIFQNSGVTNVDVMRMY